MPEKRFIMNAGRTTKQGQQINVGKDHAAYQAIVSTVTMNPEDMKALGITQGGTIRVKSECGTADFLCQEGKVPRRNAFRSLRAADLSSDGPKDRRHGDADL